MTNLKPVDPAPIEHAGCWHPTSRRRPRRSRIAGSRHQGEPPQQSLRLGDGQRLPASLWRNLSPLAMHRQPRSRPCFPASSFTRPTSLSENKASVAAGGRSMPSAWARHRTGPIYQWDPSPIRTSMASFLQIERLDDEFFAVGVVFAVRAHGRKCLPCKQCFIQVQAALWRRDV